MRKKRFLTLASAVVVTAAGLVGSTGTAAAAVEPSLSDFRLIPTNGGLQARVDALDDELPKLGVQNILDQANRTGYGPEACVLPESSKSGQESDLSPVDLYCFNQGDDETDKWWPQGITTVADAQADQYWGVKQPMLVSWYSKEDKGVRISFFDRDTKKYQHVLLVYPFINSYGNPTYEAVTTPQKGDGSNVHAGGIVWYGNYLYVADTRRGIRVFDMRYIFDIKSADNGNVEDGSKLGRFSGTYYSRGYRYVMPQVSGYSNPGGLAEFPDDGYCNVDGTPKFSYIGLDRSTTPDTMISGEYCKNLGLPETNGRVARWPMNGDNGRPLLDDGQWRATEAYRLPRPNVQGASAVDGKWYLSRTGRGKDGAGFLIEAVTDGSGSTGDLLETAAFDVAIGVEDLSYWPGRGEMWTVTEYPNRRVFYATRA